MPKGPLGGPRPFSQYRVIINPHDRSVNILKIGPFGVPRPFAKNNPPISDDEVAECMLSDAGKAFGAGVVSGGNTTDISDLPPEARQSALEITEKWCRGSMEAQAIEDMERGEAIPVLSRVRETLRGETGQPADIDIEMVTPTEEVPSEVEGEEE